MWTAAARPLRRPSSGSLPPRSRSATAAACRRRCVPAGFRRSRRSQTSTSASSRRSSESRSTRCTSSASWTHPGLLVVDEIGYLPITRSGAILFFQLVNRRYEHASTVLTSNQGFERWGEILHDEVMAAALLDRLLHRCHIVNIRGNSYRMRRHTELSKAIHPTAARALSAERSARGDAVVGLRQRPRARPATVAPLPPQCGRRSVRFSMARSVRFSAAIDSGGIENFCSAPCGALHRSRRRALLIVVVHMYSTLPWLS